MGRAPCCDKSKVKRGPWSPQEDATLKHYLHTHGTPGNWISLPHRAGLNRCGKSCRLRWLNYLRPDIKHGPFTEDEDLVIFALYNQIGSRWAVIASKLQGRTDNDVKNHWNTNLKKKLLMTPTTSSIANTSTPDFSCINNLYLAFDGTKVPCHAHFHNPMTYPSQEHLEPFDYPNPSALQPWQNPISSMEFGDTDDSLGILRTNATTNVINDKNADGFLIDDNDGYYLMNFGGEISYDHKGGIWSQETIIGATNY